MDSIKNCRVDYYKGARDYRSLKFFFVYEYGGQTSRSHHHCLFFDKNLDQLNHINL